MRLYSTSRTFIKYSTFQCSPSSSMPKVAGEASHSYDHLAGVSSWKSHRQSNRQAFISRRCVTHPSPRLSFVRWNTNHFESRFSPLDWQNYWLISILSRYQDQAMVESYTSFGRRVKEVLLGSMTAIGIVDETIGRFVPRDISPLTLF